MVETRAQFLYLATPLTHIILVMITSLILWSVIMLRIRLELVVVGILRISPLKMILQTQQVVTKLVTEPLLTSFIIRPLLVYH